MSEADATLAHFGIKGMRWGHRNNFKESVTGGRSIKVSGPSVTVKTRGPKGPPSPTRSAGPRTVPMKPAAPRPAGSHLVAVRPTATPPPQRSFSGPRTAAPPRHFSTPEGRRVKDHDSKMTPEQRAHRRKVILGATAVVGILGVAAAGTAAYKVSPHAISSFNKLNGASKTKVAELLAHPKAVNLKLKGGRAVNKAKLHAALHEAVIAERFKKSPQGMILNKGAKVAKGNKRVAQVAIKQDLSVLRRETESMRVMNDAEKYVGDIIKRNSSKSFRMNNKNKSFKLVGEAARAARG